MKRNAPDHWKMDDLATRLGIPLAQAVGHVELLFHLAAKQAIHGNIGKMPNTHIAKKCLWDGDADSFVDALATSRWLDKCTQQRLIVHDWHEHCDDATRKAVQRSGVDFYRPVPPTADNGGQRRTTADSESDKICLPSLAKPSQSLAKPEPQGGSGDLPRTADNVFQDLPPKLAQDEFRREWMVWEGYLRKTHKTLQPMQRLPCWLNLLERAPPGNEVAFAISTIRQAMANGWKNLYPQDEKRNDTGRTGQRSSNSSTTKRAVPGGDAWGDAERYDGRHIKVHRVGGVVAGSGESQPAIPQGQPSQPSG